MNIVKIAILRKFSNYIANIPHKASKKVANLTEKEVFLLIYE